MRLGCWVAAPRRAHCHNCDRKERKVVRELQGTRKEAAL